MPKIAFIGAGSTVFAKNLLGDILSFPELADATISLMDIDETRLRTTQMVAERIAQAVGRPPDHRSHPRPARSPGRGRSTPSPCSRSAATARAR